MSNPHTELGHTLLDGHRVHRAMVIGLIVWATLAHLAGVTNVWNPSSDSALYMSAGRSLANGQGYQFNGHACTDVAPGLPLVLAGLRTVFGEACWPANLLMALSALVAGWMIYLVIARLEDKATGISVAAICVLSFTFFENGHRILTDMPFTALLWSAMFLALRPEGSLWRQSVGAVLLIVAAVMIRAPGVLAIGAMSVGLLLDVSRGGTLRRRAVAAGSLLAPAIAVAGSFLLWAHTAASTPLYARIATRAVRGGMERTAGDLLKGFGELPSVVALEFTSQKAHVFLEIGMLLVVLTAVGAVVLWRRGRRFPAAALAIYFLALLLVGGGPRAMRERYFMPLLPLMAWCMIAGMCSCAGWLACRLRRNPHRAAVAAVTILVLLLIGTNQPKVARGAFYYSYLAHTGQYYDHLQNRPYVELMAISKLVNDRTPAPAEVAMTPDRISVLHYVTGRRITQLPLGPQTTADDAAAAGAAITKETATAVFGIEKASNVFRRRLSDEMLAAGFEQRYAGSFYMAYCRLPPRAAGDSR